MPPELARVHMVGIGGAGMSGIAHPARPRRAGVGFGRQGIPRRRRAAGQGAEISIGHDAANLDLLPGGPTAVITTHAAIPKTNPELVEARRRGCPSSCGPRCWLLMAGHRTLMVTGTHGKTTTTSMLIVALQHAGFDPSFAVGGDLGQAGTNAHHGSGDTFVAEADESDGSLLEYVPDVAVVTNIEADHLDFFGSRQAYTAVFDEFVDRLAPGGSLVVCADDPGAAALAERSAARGVRVLRYGSLAYSPTRTRWPPRWWTGSSREPARSPRSNWPGSPSHGRCAWRCPAGTWLSTPWLRCWPRPRPVPPSLTCSTPWPASRACVGASNWSARSAACGCSTTMRIIRPRYVPR